MHRIISHEEQEGNDGAKKKKGNLRGFVAKRCS